MASSPSQIDYLSSLPDALLITILSLLPTCIAARTSVLCRRFRHLWKASPSVDLSITCPRFRGPFYHLWETFVSMANSALLSRTPSNPLRRLNLEIHPLLPCDLTDSFISSLLVHAHALGLCHLTIRYSSNFQDSESVLCSVFSISSLESLSIRINSTFTSEISFTRLRSLSINFSTVNSTQVQRLLSELCCLEDLQVSVSSWIQNVCLSSRTVKKLELCFSFFDSLRLSMPSLEFICLEKHSDGRNLPLIHGEIPFIKKAVLTLDWVRQEQITAVAQFLNFISHVEELSLDLEKYRLSDYPFSVLMEPGKEVPTFPNLKHLDVHICFHEFNFEAVVTILRHCPALQSLKLHHKTPDMWAVQKRKRNVWRSKLPRNRDGNYQYASFKNLHLGENREEFEKLLNKKCTPKRQQIGS